MKKKCLVLAVAAALVLSMAGCGKAKKYEKDIDSFLEVADLDFYDIDDLDELDEVKEEFGELEFVTDEGIEFQKTFEDLLDLYEEALELDEAYNDDEIDYDEYEEEIEKFEEESEELGEEMRDLLEDFYDAAEEAGIDEDLLEDLEDEFDL